MARFQQPERRVSSPSNPERDPRENHLLDALPANARERIFPHMRLTEMPRGMAVHESGDTPRDVYFPIDAIVSLLNVLKSGASAEIAVVGNDGAVGLEMFMGGHTTFNRAVVQSAGSAYRFPIQRLKDELNRHGQLLHVLLRYIQSLISQMSQTAVCNRHHSLEQQLCRWLLHSLDRLSSNQLNVTQELIASMLGVRREGVTKAAGNLQALGVIECARGRITVLDRPRLEKHSCECYAALRTDADRLRSAPALA